MTTTSVHSPRRAALAPPPGWLLLTTAVLAYLAGQAASGWWIVLVVPVAVATWLTLADPGWRLWCTRRARRACRRR